MSAEAGALLARVPLGAPVSDPGAILDRFLDWVTSLGLEPYPAQEQALLELLAGRHVVLDTPTGSGKSLVALGLHFKALCEGRRSFYTAPIKALVSEKFFTLCDLFGAGQVGMLTGDASINWAAPIICCTAEVLSNMALRQGEATDAPYVVMDEFHYYADRDRGSAWQIPLLVLRRTQFLLMSATLGNTASIEERLRADSGREVSHVWSDHRPVPLDFDYRETPLQETVEDLREEGRAPIYVVSFTQRECAELAQALTSAHVCTREERQVLASELAEFRFDTPYGKDVRRFLSHGIGLHHAGLLPKYRLLVEQLSQRGLLKVICGTDTLGVGVNIPIRTVLFSKLCKYDGEKVRLLTVRDFKQIAGRAGRKGFDDKGSVVCQAPEHVTRNRRAAARPQREGARRPARRPPPSRGFVPWNRDIFEQLIRRPSESLRSQLRVTHGMLVSVLQREDADAASAAAPRGSGGRGGYHLLIELIGRCHEDTRRKRRLRREAAVLFRSLRRAGIVEVTLDPVTRRSRVRVDVELQRDFSLHQTLSLYLVEALSALDPTAPGYALDVLSLVEAVLEDPGAILQAQVRKLRDEQMAKLKAEGVPFEERITRLDEVTHLKPSEDFIYATFNLFAEHHPWVGRENIHPKGVAREMAQEWIRFDDYVRRYAIQRVEGLLLRYLGQVWSTLQRSVPDAAKSDEIHDVLAYFGTLIERVDSSLLEEWQSLIHPERRLVREAEGAGPPRDEPGPKAFRARVRAELHALVQALSQRDFEEAALRVGQDPDDPWDAARFETTLAPYFAEYAEIRFDPEARQSRLTQIRPAGAHRFDITQTLLDPAGDGLWCIEGEVDLAPGRDFEGPLLRVRRIGT